MLGINGQSKSMSSRGGATKKSVDKPAVKLPAVGTQKVATAPHQPVGGVKRRAMQSAAPTQPIKHMPDTVHVPIIGSVLEIAKRQLSLPPGDNTVCGTVKVRFNHYNKSFPIYNGVLKWADVDEEYCLSFVYRGNFGRELVFIPVDSTVNSSRVTAQHDDAFTYYIDMVSNSEYRLEVTEDHLAGIGAEGLRLNAGPLKSTELSSIQTSQKAIKSTTLAMDTITAELKSIAVTDLNGAHAKDLIERRDLEDILFST